MSPTPKPRWPRWRVLAAAVVALGLVVLAGLHLPVARSQVLSWVSTELGRRGIRFDARRLDYNLTTMTVGLDHVVVSAAGDKEAFFEADAVRLNLPLAVFGGALRVQSIELDRPRVHVVRRADGSWNLPRTSSTDTGPLLREPLEIDHIVVRNLSVEYEDAIQHVTVQSRGVSLDLHRPAGRDLAGRLAMSESAIVRQGERTTTVSKLEGALSFDGRTVSIAGLDLAAPEGQARIAGLVGPFTAEPRLDLTVDGALDVDRVSTWFAMTTRPAGRVVVRGTVTGPFSEPRVEILAASQGLTWPAVGALSLDARTTIGEGYVDASLRVGVVSGEVEATGRVALDPAGRSDANVQWRALDVGALARSASTLPVYPSAIADGTLAVSWTGQDMTGAKGRLIMSLRESVTRAAGLPLSGRIEASVEDRRWTMTANTAAADAMTLAGTIGGRLEETLTASTVNGQATLRAADVDRALRTLNAAGINVGMVAVTGSASTDVTVAGTFALPRASGTIEATGLTVEGTGPAAASVPFSTTSDALTIDQARISLDANVITASGSLDFATRRLKGQFDGDLGNLSALGMALPERWRPAGIGRVNGRLAGTIAGPLFDLTLSAANVRLAEQPIDSVRSTLRLAGGVVTVTAFEAVQRDGRLNATGQYALDTRRYTFEAMGTDLAIEQTPLRARGNLRFGGAGVIDRPEATGTLDFGLLEWAEYSLAPVHTDVTLANGRLRTRATMPSLGGQLDATVDLDTRTISATADVVNADLSTLTRGSTPGRRRPGRLDQLRRLGGGIPG